MHSQTHVILLHSKQKIIRSFSSRLNQSTHGEGKQIEKKWKKINNIQLSLSYVKRLLCKKQLKLLVLNLLRLREIDECMVLPSLNTNGHVPTTNAPEIKNFTRRSLLFVLSCG